VTPYWTWHGHGNDSENEVIWLDGLDNGILRLFDATFFQLPFFENEEERSADQTPASSTTQEPHWHYSWDSMQGRLGRLQRDALDRSHGYRVRYSDPRSGKDPLPTISAFLSRLPAGYEGEWYRSSDSAVFVVARGSGRTELDGQTIQWSENDIFIVPTWTRYRHVTPDDAVLFSFSDRNAQERLECWREERDVV
jgi:gentisate 1,2-dioxygenase